MTNEVKALAKAAAERNPQGWFEDIIDALMPFFQQFLEKLLESCGTTERRALELFTNPRPYQVSRTESKAMRAFNRCTEFARLSYNDQQAVVGDMMSDTYDTAREQPELVSAAWRSVHTNRVRSDGSCDDC